MALEAYSPLQRRRLALAQHQLKVQCFRPTDLMSSSVIARPKALRLISRSSIRANIFCRSIIDGSSGTRTGSNFSAASCSFLGQLTRTQARGGRSMSAEGGCRSAGTRGVKKPPTPSVRISARRTSPGRNFIGNAFASQAGRQLHRPRPERRRFGSQCDHQCLPRQPPVS
jgi:hypothetical protein